MCSGSYVNALRWRKMAAAQRGGRGARARFVYAAVRGACRMACCAKVRQPLRVCEFWWLNLNPYLFAGHTLSLQLGSSLLSTKKVTTTLTDRFAEQSIPFFLPTLKEELKHLSNKFVEEFSKKISVQ
ncbi:hypothetical protein NPIL_449061 [Nephila pilipes]|uniref:Uncharacterized protein n=1 Tax=Nephila pilipes TaxID=299642 RepID=A0A8X6UQM8_NEPPI|nr:hypothetical protein NPIL_449061 [Nephila pilipes]